MTMDSFGNLYKIVGDGSSKIVWSSHTDTVHRMDGFQAIQFANGYAALAEGETSNCLGGDCTTGIYIMTEMIKADVPGLYIFHRDEESGGKGSSRFAVTHRELLSQYSIAIAFDRRATNSVITFQGSRCCSDKFADSLIEQMPTYKKDTGGTFTDTANYTHIIPECTNLSVGYYNEHTKTEMQDVDHIADILSAMITLNQSKLIVERDPKAPDEYPSYADFGWGRARYYDDYYDSYLYSGKSSKKNNKRKQQNRSGITTINGAAAQSAKVFLDNYEEEKPFDEIQTRRNKMVELIVENPLGIAFLLEQYGLTSEDIEAFIYAA